VTEGSATQPVKVTRLIVLPFRMLKADPDTDFMAFSLPDAVTLPLWLWLLPIVTEPKLIEPGVTPNVPLEVAPVPDSARVTVGSEAFELSERVALAVPATVGEKTTDRLTLLPAARVYGKVKPPTVKAEPLAIADEILRLDPPEFVNVSACV